MSKTNTTLAALTGPPDGSRLAGIEARRRWLSRPDIVYSLPCEGCLLFRASSVFPHLSIGDGCALRRAHADDEEEISLAVTDDALLAAWDAAWRSTMPAQGAEKPAGLLHYRGLLREVSELPEVFAALVARHLRE